MPNQTVFPRLPTPMWSGTTADATQGFIQYCTSIRRDDRVLVQKQRELRNANEYIELYTDHIKRYGERLKQLQPQLETARGRMLPAMTEEEAEEEVRRIMALPGFIGIRTDEFGHLVIALRIILGFDGAMYDLGDFEMLYGNENYRGAQFISYRIIRSASHYSYFGFEAMHEVGGAYYGNFYPTQFFDTGVVNRLRNNGLIYEHLLALINAVCQAAARSARALVEITADAPDPEHRWNGVMSTATALYARTVTKLRNTETARMVAELEGNLAHYESERQYAVTNVREYTQKRARLTAQIRELEAQDDIVHDEAGAVRMLRYILTLPGVMGMRLDEDGKPVFHVRTTHVYRGRRYDMGDFELYIGRDGDRGVIEILMTRKPNGQPGARDAHIYFHASNVRHDNRITGWFCFGSRAAQLQQMWNNAQLADFMHLAVNTMNAVNEGNEGYLGEYYRQINMEDVWRPRQARLRRVPRAEHERRLRENIHRTVAD